MTLFGWHFDTSDRDPRETLLKIDGVEYKFKDGVRSSTNKRFVGYIAQQIESLVPEAVQLIDGKKMHHFFWKT